MHTEFYGCLVLFPKNGLDSVREQNKAERVTSSPVDPGISRGVTDLYPSRGYTPRNTRDRSIPRSLQSCVSIKKSYLVDLTAEVYFSSFYYKRAVGVSRSLHR